MSNNPISANIFEMAMHNSSHALLLKLNEKELKELIDAATDPSFGKEGTHRYFCNKCNGRWFFETKEDRSLFVKFHKTFKCDYTDEVYTKDKKDKNGNIVRKITGIVKKRTGNVLSDIGLKYMEELLAIKEEANENKVDEISYQSLPADELAKINGIENEKIETVVPTEQETTLD